MRKLFRLLTAAIAFIGSPVTALAAPTTKSGVPMVTPTPTVTPTPMPIATPIAAAVSQSTQNTIFFIVVAVLLVAIIWYILGMPDEEDEEEAKKEEPAKGKMSPSPIRKASKKRPTRHKR